jgi:glycosyltransferase involved in cell wall biosynthesis
VRINHIFKTYFPDTQGGIEETIRQLATYTSTVHGVENYIYTVSSKPHSSPIRMDEGVVVQYKQNLDVASTPMSASFARNFREIMSSADIIHFHFPWPFAEVLYLASSVKTARTIVTYQSDIVKQRIIKKFYNPMLKMFLKRVDLIVPSTQNLLDSSLDLAPFRSKCSPIPNFIDRSRFDTAAANFDGEVAAKYGTDFFLFVGVLRYYKGLQYLIPAMKGIKNKLVIIGKGPELGTLKKLVEDQGLTNVKFAGYVSDSELPSYYRQSRAFIFPSCERSEAFGMTILEAFLFKKPVVSTELGTGTSYVNLDGKTGMVVKPKNVEALHQALLLFSKNDDLLKQYGENGHKRMVDLFSPEVAGEKYYQVYQNLLKK